MTDIGVSSLVWTTVVVLVCLLCGTDIGVSSLVWTTVVFVG